ncbi:T6SS phospholipase effector Tle1-like catalytic domain-containing protein [Serratia bockelmannii]|uniref:T6SS phospholipase effector Tle1-like catalytic domain-containing protein n=1 Tax=Serratia bockelmannii TaxID=2703793 RepID=UPI003FA6AD63
MSEIKETDLAWVPPLFPAQGRLPTQAQQVGQNLYQQDSAELLYRQELCLAAGRRVAPPCCKTLHISLFFDGTGNNLNNDLLLSNPKHPTNIARLFRATIGDGTAGGVSDKRKVPLDAASDSGGKYFKFYIPGVGTPFPEVNDLDYSTMGLVGAAKGEERINWALLRIIDVLMRVSKDPLNNSIKLSEGESRKSIGNMGTSWNRLWFGGSHNRYEEFSRLLNGLAPKLKPLITQPEPGKPKLLGIKLYVYGFSRGAAAARAFVRWLSELLPPPKAEGENPPQCLQIGDMQLPISVEFLGLLDTVASVGVAHVVPIAEGHMSWADGTMELPDDETYGGLIKKCVHLVSGHEQRLCFPLDSVRRGNGKYPPYATEVVYPGMHSDIGGGYPPGDQGKANGKDDALLLSQIPLHEMYAAAFSAGAPLKVPQEFLPKDFQSDSWRRMPLDLLDNFFVDEVLIKRFNAWRELTLNLTTPEKITAEEAASYNPPCASGSLESLVDNQIAWITAWRIDRYAKGTLVEQRFYKAATDKEALPAARKAAEEARDAKQREVLKTRQDQIAKQPVDQMDDLVLHPGVKDFDPKMDKPQLFEAAKEFGKDYHDGYRIPDNLAQAVLDTVLQPMIFVLNTDDEPQEYRRIKTAGDARVAVLFPAAGEASNAQQPAGLVRALFDDQVHDSRAWFMHAALGTREMWAGYFRYRMIYFSDQCNKSLSPLVIAGNVVGFATLVTGVALSFKQKSLTGKLAGLAATGAVRSLQVEVLDRLTGLPLPALPGGEQLRAFTNEPGVVVAQQKAFVAQQQQLRLARAQAAIPASWLEQALETIT